MHSLMYLPAKQLFNGMRFCQRVCWWARYFGSRDEAMDGKATVMPPVCCILRMCVGIDHCNYILGLLSRPFLRNRYGRVRVSYDAMWVLLCTLHSAMDYRLFISGLLRSILMWSIVRETTTNWFDAVAYGWVCHIWVVNSGNDDIIFHDIQLTPSLVMNWRFTGWWMFLLIRTALLLAH